MSKETVSNFIKNEFIDKFIAELECKEKEYMIGDPYKTPWGLTESTAEIGGVSIMLVFNAYISRHASVIFDMLRNEYSDIDNENYKIISRRMVDLISNLFILWMFISKKHLDGSKYQFDNI